MMAGKRVNLASLVSADVFEPASSATAVSLKSVAPNPLNPRNDLGDLSELIQSLETVGQLQACTAVTKLAYLAVYPEHRDQIGQASYVIILGGRRLAAAQASASINHIDIAVKDHLAKSRESLAAAAVVENIERRGFDPIEEAYAVQHLIELMGAKQDVAKHLSRSNGWISQRLGLLRLHPEVQAQVRTGTIPVREARELVKLDPSQQLSAWQTHKASGDGFFTAVKNPSPTIATTATSPAVASGDEKNFYRGKKPLSTPALLAQSPHHIASMLRQHLTAADCHLLAQLLLAETS